MMHVFYCYDIDEWWVAESAAHATELSSKACGMEPGTPGVPLVDEWDQIPDERALRINEAEKPGGPPVTKTCREWCDESGPGLLCAVER